MSGRVSCINRQERVWKLSLCVLSKAKYCEKKEQGAFLSFNISICQDIAHQCDGSPTDAAESLLYTDKRKVQ